MYCLFIYLVIRTFVRYWKEGNVLFNNALNTFYLQLYGVRHMVKDHSDSERGNSFRLAARVLLYRSIMVDPFSYFGSGTWLRGRAFAHGAMGRRIDPSWAGPIELFLVPASAPRLV